MTMTDENTSRIDTLRRARGRRPWTDELLVESAADPAAFKEWTPACEACPRPCEADEVCVTAVAKTGDLFESMGRDQAYHLLENGTTRLRTRGEAALRTADRPRPNTFLRLTADTEELGVGDRGPAATGDGELAAAGDGESAESHDERRTNDGGDHE